jgi:hypothetical protein
MSDFDKLKDDVEKEAQEHPEQVKEGEQAAAKEFGLQQQDQSQSGPSQSGQSGQSGQDAGGNQGQGSGQGQ